jgi:hypothetical protein
VEVQGREVLDAYVADTTPEITWKNPLSEYPLSDGELIVACEILSIARAVSEDIEPEYGAHNGRIDREVDLAMSFSWSHNNESVEL